MADTSRVDIEQPGANMYGCLPCPVCHSEFRYPTISGIIRCDDCGHCEQRKAEETR